MVHFFGVLNPGFGVRVDSDEAPLKADFFGGATEGERLSRAEFDADLLNGRVPDTAPLAGEGLGRRFVRLSVPPFF